MRIQNSSKVLGIIPARYGSSRFPGKPLAPILGKSLIQHTYENALQCPLFHDLLIATDDERIYLHALTFGAQVVMTSTTCMNGSDRLVEVLKNHPQFDDFSIIVNVQGDMPCLDPTVMQCVAELLLCDPFAVMATAVAPLESYEEALNPSVVKCVLDKNFNALYFSRALIPSSHVPGLHKNISYYKHLGIYAYRRDFLLQYAELAATPLQIAEDLEQLKILEHGFRIKTAIVASDSIGVDTPNDVKKVEELLCKQNTFSLQAEYAPL